MQIIDNDHSSIKKAMEIMQPIAEMFMRGEIQATDLMQERNRRLIEANVHYPGVPVAKLNKEAGSAQRKRAPRPSAKAGDKVVGQQQGDDVVEGKPGDDTGSQEKGKPGEDVVEGKPGDATGSQEQRNPGEPLVESTPPTPDGPSRTRSRSRSPRDHWPDAARPMPSSEGSNPF